MGIVGVPAVIALAAFATTAPAPSTPPSTAPLALTVVAGARLLAVSFGLVPFTLVRGIILKVAFCGRSGGLLGTRLIVVPAIAILAAPAATATAAPAVLALTAFAALTAARLAGLALDTLFAV